MVSDEIVAAIEGELGPGLKAVTTIKADSLTSVLKVTLGNSSFLVKVVDSKEESRLKSEWNGLQLLDRAVAGIPAIATPRRVLFLRCGDQILGVQEWISSAAPRSDAEHKLGCGLAAMHETTGACYGLAEDNFIGGSVQRNQSAGTWPEFFRSARLGQQVQTAIKLRRWNRQWEAAWMTVQKRLEDILPENPPASVLHGDLWSGNALFASSGVWYLIDPAVYYGHAETDLAMTTLFGGFGPDVIASYDGTVVPEPGRAERFELYNLYHLLNHLNLFGEIYAEAVDRVFRRFA